MLIRSNHQLECCKIRQMAGKLDGSRAIAKHMKNQPISKSQAKVNQLRHRKVYLPPHKGRARSRKMPSKSGQSQTRHSKKACFHLSKNPSSHHKHMPSPKIVTKGCHIVPSVVIPGIDQYITVLQADISKIIAQNMDSLQVSVCLQVSVSTLIPRKCKLAYIQ